MNYIKPHFLYFKYLVKHKWAVFRWGLKLRVPFWRLIFHDWSKCRPCEWVPYVNNFFGGQKDKAEFDKAWNHHQKTNPHHWQYWILHKDDGTVKYLEMPHTYVREMLADWMGAGEAQGKGYPPEEVNRWFVENKHKIKLHPKTWGVVCWYLRIIEKEKWEQLKISKYLP